LLIADRNRGRCGIGRSIGQTRRARGGAAVGIAASLGVSRLLSSTLYEVNPGDPVTLVGSAIVLIAVALAACYVPARRATRVDPLVALRYE